MKKGFKRISTIVFAIIITLSNLVGVKAYDKTIKLSDNILIDLENNDYISLSDNLMNDSAVVYQQNISITKEQFDAMVAKVNSNNKYVEEQAVFIQQKVSELKTLSEKLAELKIAAEKEGATEAEKKAYEDAKNNFQLKEEELEKISASIDAQTEQNNADFNKMIPDFDNTKWSKINLTEKTDYSNRYKVNFTDDSYFVIWIKVTLNGNDYFKFGIYCEKEKDEPKYCEIVDGKYYNKQGKEVTEAEYKADCEEKKVCKIENGKYYNKQGKEVTEAEYKADCEEKKVCKIENGKYYNKQGKEVTEAEYKADCENLYVCEYKNGKWYNKSGKEVTEAEYKKDCDEVVINVCRIVDGKYYDNNGKEVTKAEYEKACTTPDNPKTGLNNNMLYGVLITLVAASSYVVVRKARKFSR